MPLPTRPLNVAVGGVPVRTASVATQADLTRVAPVRVEGRWITPTFACGPALTKLVQIWDGSTPWQPSARRTRRALKAMSRDTGLRERDARLGRWGESDPTVRDALCLIDWKALLKAPSLTPADAEFWHRARLHQTYCWNAASESLQCPHSDCSVSSPAGPAHILWSCPHAHEIWRGVFQIWGCDEMADDAMKTHVFGWIPPPTTFDWPSMVRTSGYVHTEDEVDIAPRTEYWIEKAWIHLVTAAARGLWRAHVALSVGDPNPDCDGPVYALQTRWRRRLLHLREWAHHSPSPRLDQAIHRILCRHLVMPSEEVPRLSLSSDQFLLFFDGGSRGNPGPGGSGSIIVRVRAGFEIVWMAAMSYADRATTNNVAEFKGLCTGLNAAVRHNWHPLTVVGDSSMILTLMRKRRRPKSERLRPLYNQARRAAASLRISGWHHHYRSKNKMADKAANIAMDARRTMQAYGHDARHEFDPIHTLLANDMGPWVDHLLLSTGAPGRQPVLP